MLSLLLLLVFCVENIAAVDPLVDLGYTKYNGTALPDGVTQWLGIRYASQISRVDSMRFTAPQDPPANSSIQQADRYGPLCIGTTFDLKTEFGSIESEDCLFANIYASSKATSANLVPVFVFIQGGGFNGNSNANYNGSSLIHAGDMDMVVVNFNYRVGPYGFLASKEIAGNNSFSLNNGLKDQRQLLKWVNTHIKQFGGDPNQVVLGGASAGGGSVILQTTAYGGVDNSLFHGIATESQAFPALRTVQESEFMYEALLKAAGCSNLQCLQEMDAVKFQTAVRGLKIPFPGAADPPVYFWGPTLDYDFIKGYTYEELEAGHFVKVPAIFGDDTNEGIIFTPKTIDSEKLADQFIKDQFPTVTTSELSQLRAVFPGPSNTQSDPAWRTQAAQVYGHLRYICPGMNVSSVFSNTNGAKTWNYRWNVGGATHVSELSSVFYDGDTDAGKFIHQYWASFIRSLDPNTYRMSGAPTWDNWGGSNGSTRIVFNDKNVVNMEDVPSQEQQACDVVNNLGVALEQ
ncbi:alpha/beta-hydrolase [Glonium stellatum]|uniref:Carboxylic ester hydrolase n=1 Tax=Glonium stellatum TaxID=574774 RepID=A0A8E2JN72_9PEZI|nr:alpha/beta-hydrolase [Glonium stellatum]